MPRRHTEEKLAALKATLAHHHLDAGQRDLLENEVRTLEQRLAVQPPMNPETLQDYLRQWEARLEVEHPVLAAVVTDALRKLAAMGI